MSDALVVQSPRVTDAEIFEALDASRGNLSEAARQLGMRRTVIRERISRVPALAALLDECRETVLDRAEQNQYDDVFKGDPSASRFMLQTLGKDRGYSTSIVGAGKDGAIVVEIRKFTEEDSSGQV